jgi:hypothetical protein
LCAVNPADFEIQCKDGGPSAVALQIAHTSLAHLKRKPHKEALEWRWQRWKKIHLVEQSSSA